MLTCVSSEWSLLVLDIIPRCKVVIMIQVNRGKMFPGLLLIHFVFLGKMNEWHKRGMKRCLIQKNNKKKMRFQCPGHHLSKFSFLFPFSSLLPIRTSTTAVVTATNCNSATVYFIEGGDILPPILLPCGRIYAIHKLLCP